jgi:hypothetical protein
MSRSSIPSIGKQEACKTYIEQTKLLVTLASAFLLAPAGLVAILKDWTSVGIASEELFWFVAAEVLFVLSVLAGYFVLGSLAGSQDKNQFDVFRSATRVSSLLQFGLYVGGMGAFGYLAVQLITKVR